MEIELALSRIGRRFSCWTGEVRDWTMVFVDFDVRTKVTFDKFFEPFN